MNETMTITNTLDGGIELFRNRGWIFSLHEFKGSNLDGKI
jgi:hypothetical protein